MDSILIKIVQCETILYGKHPTDFNSILTMCRILTSVFDLSMRTLEVNEPYENLASLQIKELLICMVKVCHLREGGLRNMTVMKFIDGCVKDLPFTDCDGETLESWWKEIKQSTVPKSQIVDDE